jgi:hypothetical protein
MVSAWTVKPVHVEVLGLDFVLPIGKMRDYTKAEGRICFADRGATA